MNILRHINEGVCHLTSESHWYSGCIVIVVFVDLYTCRILYINQGGKDAAVNA